MEDLQGKLGTIAIIGGGKMGEAIIAGLVNGALFDPATVVVAEPGEERRQYLSDNYGIRCVAAGAEIDHPLTAILAVKPQVFRDVAAALAAAPNFDPVRIISIAAGISTATIRGFFPEKNVIRVMPNVALMVSAGMCVVCTAENTARSEGELVVDLFSLMGEATLIEESQINAATALSGSGPAYFALLVERLAAAGVAQGLDAETAALLAKQTLIGTARYLDLTSFTATELREAVTSPNGTTQAALESMAASGFNQLVDDLVAAACRRAEELA
ncbi:MAG: pyrroline-5-carboxylate reductase [Coriobacteriales bacterium]|jgi:pyrroline-5-carboxylate reductase|nr:pyrroline-5-carboxylate reductase [Coriobacteriales bacterium]